jgi:gliding motility-associated-like protein
VSILEPGQQVEMEWTHEDTSKTDGFVITRYWRDRGVMADTNSIYLPKTVTKYRFSYDTVRYKPVRFRVRAYKGIIPGISADHTTIYASSTYDTCNNRINILWTKYVGWGNKLTTYQVREALTQKVYATLASSDTSYILPNVTTDSTYTFVIVATSSDGYASFSNIDSIYTEAPGLPSNVGAQSASFIAQSQVRVTFALDAAAELKNYRLLKSNNPGGPWDTVYTTLNYASPLFEYTDNVTGGASVYYRLDALNVCERGILSSKLVTGIVPEYNISDLHVNLTWDEYLDGVQGYRVFRTIGTGTPAELTNLPITDTNFSDDIGSVAGQQLSGNICYTVESISEDILGNTNTSLSQTVCIDLSSEIFIPTGFTPNGDNVNDEFKASFAFIPEKFVMVLYDRYGFKVFETKDATKGWNGLLKNGSKAPEAVYIYFISFTTSDGKKIEKKGNFTLIYP